MRVRIALGSLAAASLLLFAPARSWGQNVPSPFRFVETRQEFGAFVGTSSVGTGRFGFGPAGGIDYGARWGIRLSGPLGFEGVASVMSGTRDVINPARLEGDRKIGEANVRLGSVDARLRFTLTGDRSWHDLAPFVVAGGGMVFNLAATQEIDQQLDTQDRFSFSSSFLGTLGGGTHLYLTDRLALRGDAIFSLWKIKTPPGFSDPNRGIQNVAESEWVSGLHFSISAMLRY